ncbi:Glycosyltransferase involved in cell wall bisynthesis [Parapedobacter composti]|uniref:Glycosyltransferase involved in cell wall bisynthesis n=1 Tax=Parapedobacter composti TaxID=623281 RepID=A0A1I1DU45_9SPHI|nr:glycosyltransferase family 2 protein [Parapedobacter composti]SFB78411.1 Glycosyltransferase involved in cell wall bisynthesis [Parapedobacter composti]
MKRYILSIITVNLNNREGLERTIASVVSQNTNVDYEYIVIDGQSDDGSLAVIKKYSDRLTYWVSESDEGVYDAMNKGIRAASGDYLLFLNSGDILTDTTVLGDVFKKLDGTDVVYGDIYFNYGTYQERYYYPRELSFQFFCEKSLGHPATFIRRELFFKYGLYDLSYPIAADWVFFSRVICKYNVTTKHVPVAISIFDMKGMSNDPSNKQRIADERNRFLSAEFSVFMVDYRAYKRIQDELSRIKSSKAYRWLRTLGVKKFKD